MKKEELKKTDLLEGDLDFVDFFINQPEPKLNRLKNFRNVKSSGYFYELVYCLLTPQPRSVSLSKRFLYKIPSDKSQTSDGNEEQVSCDYASIEKRFACFWLPKFSYSRQVHT
ncbi:MAG: hypothetical protein QME25_00170 [Bacteroidota bacterium]|nr:hypothetical protein [Bacteroidota bacterium]